MKGVKIAVAVACSCLAVFFFFRLRAPAESEIPNTPESATTWMCRKCNHDYSLTAREFEQEERRVSRNRDRGFGPLRCPTCGKEEAWRANRCPVHGIMFFVADVPGSDGLCPECKPKRKAAEEQQEAAPEKRKVPAL